MKNFENQLLFGKVRDKNRVVHPDTVYNVPILLFCLSEMRDVKIASELRSVITWLKISNLQFKAILYLKLCVTRSYC